jgi:hypothetical protein
VVAVSFVHGHPRAAGWVVAHVRRPNLPEAGQLPLLPATPDPQRHPRSSSASSRRFGDQGIGLQAVGVSGNPCGHDELVRARVIDQDL